MKGFIGRFIINLLLLALDVVGIGVIVVVLHRYSLHRGIAPLVLMLAGLVAVFVIAEAGGKIRHPEFRLSDPPIFDAPGRLR